MVFCLSGKKEPIKSGSIAKFYLLAYPREIHGYELSKHEDLKIDKSYYSRMGSRYHELFHIKTVIVNGRSRKYFKSKPHPLLDQITISLKKKDIQLTDPEEIELIEFLDGPFRQTIKLAEALEESSPLEYFYNNLGLNSLASLKKRENPDRTKSKDIGINPIYDKLSLRLLKKLVKLPPPYLLNLIDKSMG